MSAPPGSRDSRPAGRPASSKIAHQGDAAADRGAGVRLEQHRVAQRQRRGDGADGEDQREVERRITLTTPTGRRRAKRPAVLVGGQHVAGRQRGQRGGFVAFVGGDVGFQPGLGADAAGFADDPGLDLLGVFFPERAGAAQHRGAFLGFAGGPFLLRGGGNGRRLVHVLDRGHAVGAQRVAGGRFHGCSGAGTAVAPAVEVDLALPQGGIKQGHVPSFQSWVGSFRPPRGGPGVWV